MTGLSGELTLFPFSFKFLISEFLCVVTGVIYTEDSKGPGAISIPWIVTCSRETGCTNALWPVDV